MLNELITYLETQGYQESGQGIRREDMICYRRYSDYHAYGAFGSEEQCVIIYTMDIDIINQVYNRLGLIPRIAKHNMFVNCLEYRAYTD